VISRVKNSQHEHTSVEIPTIIVAAAIYCGFLVVTWSFDDLPLMVAAPVTALLLAWHSSFQHETIHGHPTNSRRINTLFGWPPLSLWLPYEVYRETHWRHHRCKGRRLTQPADDPESHYLPAGALSGAAPAVRMIFWLNRTFAGRLILGPALSVTRFWVAELRRLTAGEPARLRVWIRHAASVAVVVAWVVGVCHIPLSLYVAAMIYPAIALGQLRSFAEHRAHADAKFRTVSVETNWLFRLLFLNNNLHIAHHAKPSMPWYELPSAWRAMRHGAIGVGMTVEPGYRSLLSRHFLRPIIAAEYPAASATVP